MTSRFGSLVLSVCIFAFFAVGAAQSQGAPYLALGDSVTFGFITQAGFQYVNPINFLGYPTYVGPNLALSARDAACPGETTGSFLSSTAPDLGCRAFRSKFPLHVFYTSTQLAYAKQFLINHPGTKLVTLLLGANDLFLLQEACKGDPTCINNGLPAVLAEITANLVTIVRDLRATGYSGTIFLLNYYSLDYSSTAQTEVAVALDQAIAAAGAATHVRVVDVFSAFRLAAFLFPHASGNTCHAGLLNVNPQNELLCDVHPSQSGQQLLAVTVEAAFRLGL